MKRFHNHSEIEAEMANPQGWRFKPECGPAEFLCSDCKAFKPIPLDGCGTGYARDNSDNLICYQCAGKRDEAEMVASGKAVLYLSHHGGDGWRVTNWPGTLSIRPQSVQSGRHNFARTRKDVWFIGPDQARWHGVQLGEFSQICRCKRLKA